MSEKRINPRDRAFLMLKEADQMIADISSWNDNRPDSPPIDMEDLRILRVKLQTAIKRWDEGDRDPHLFRDVVEYAESKIED